MTKLSTKELAKRIRIHVLRMTNKAQTSHVGTCLSSADILAVLYGLVLRVDPLKPDKSDRDRFLLSKGHGAAALYAALAEVGFFPTNQLDGFAADGKELAGHVNHHGVPGVEVSTGSLGHGLSIGCGMALALRSKHPSVRVIVLLSDGELNEGSTWESIMFAGHHKLSNLCAIIDCNGIQSLGNTEDILDIEPIGEKFKSNKWEVVEVDGHNHDELSHALDANGRSDFPKIVVARTVKGRGVSFMENKLEWHYRSPSDQDLDTAIEDVEGSV